ncbi:MAG: NADH-quinone oxidoreductase subunit L [Myxococcales bacterium]|nr:NADH-quinone oxidoreductase subunit L [Myxococcales bacterium]
MSQSILGIPLLAWIPLLPILGALINLTLGRKASDRTVHTVAILAVGGAFLISAFLVFGTLWAKFQIFHAAGGAGPLPELKQVAYTWIQVGSFSVELAFRLDTLSAVMILIVTFVGTLIHIYSAGYMHGDRRYAAYFGYLNLFTGSMLILVLAANLPVMFIGWEGVGLCSFLLIGFWFENPAYADAGRKAFVVNRIGDFAFLLGMFLLYAATKDNDPSSLDFAALRGDAAQAAYVESFWGGERFAAAAGILLFIGACGKSAQIPLYVWLPDAMAGPTPVSALIHAATMVTAGVYMICRLSFLYASSTTALIVVATVGTLTALMAAFMAFAQTDLKKVLAYSTVSQLGFMFVAAGTGNWVAAIFHLGTHAFFKAGLFLGAGSVMHGMAGSGDITQMGGLRKHMPITRFTFWIYCVAIAGVPLFSGFFSKDEILAGAFFVHPPGWPAIYGKILWGALSVAALGTAFYMWRLYFLVFSGEERSETAKHAHESPVSMTGPLVVLALLATVGGFLGIPHAAHALWAKLPTDLLGTWLAPSLTSKWAEGASIMGEHSNATVGWLMLAATVMGLLGIGLAWMFYGRGPSKTVDAWVAGPLSMAHDLSKNKLYVDEIYEAIILRPFRILARGTLEIVDRFVIDTVVVNGSALAVSMFSRIARWVQNGQVQRYLVGVVLGAAAIFLITDCRRAPTFAYREIGGWIELVAKPGEGIASASAKLRWDLDGDSKPDVDQSGVEGFRSAATQRVLAGEVGSKVTLWIEDPVTKETITVTREIRLAQPAGAPGGK